MLKQAIKTFLINGSTQRMKRAPMSAINQEKWDLCAGVLVERLPVVTRSLNPIESEYLVIKSFFFIVT